MNEFEACRGKPLGQVLKHLELLGEGQVQEALQIQRGQGGRIGEILITLGYIAREELLLALAVQSGAEIVGPEPADPGEGGGPPPGAPGGGDACPILPPQSP